MPFSNSSAFLEFFLHRYAEEPEVEVPILEEPDLVVRQARFADVDRPQTGTARPKPRRSGGRGGSSRTQLPPIAPIA